MKSHCRADEFDNAYQSQQGAVNGSSRKWRVVELQAAFFSR
jgi:hypothetical protein